MTYTKVRLTGRPTESAVRIAVQGILKTRTVSDGQATELASSFLPVFKKVKPDHRFLLAATRSDTVEGRDVLKWIYVVSTPGYTMAYATNGRTLHTMEVSKSHVWFGKTGFVKPKSWKEVLPIEDITLELIRESNLPFTAGIPRCGYPNMEELVAKFKVSHTVYKPNLVDWYYNVYSDCLCLMPGYGVHVTTPRLLNHLEMDALSVLSGLNDSERLSIEYSEKSQMVCISTHGSMLKAYIPAAEFIIK